MKPGNQNPYIQQLLKQQGVQLHPQVKVVKIKKAPKSIAVNKPIKVIAAQSIQKAGQKPIGPEPPLVRKISYHGAP